MRIPCTRCGELILQETAAKNGGLCMPCKGGYRERIEQGKLRREQQSAYEQSSERKYWLMLVDRVHKQPKGFDELLQSEKTYFAVSCLIGEVFNGGFEQFFSNSSGELYGLALDGLFEMEAEVSAALLVQAKEVLFGDATVPQDRMVRIERMSAKNLEAPARGQLEGLDKAFCADQDHLDERCKSFALGHRLYSDDPG